MDPSNYTRQSIQQLFIPVIGYQEQPSNTNAVLGLHLRMTVIQTELLDVKEVGRQTFPQLLTLASVSLIEYLHGVQQFIKPTLSALDCEDEPDTGVNAGVESRTWNNLFYYATVITYKCPYGKSFHSIFYIKLQKLNLLVFRKSI